MATKKITDNILFENCKLIFCNFSGKEKPPYNAKGQRNFNVVIEDLDFAKQLAADGWNVKFPEPNEDGSQYEPHLMVKLGWNDEYPSLNPRIMMEQGDSKVYLNEDTIGTLDSMDIINVKALEVRPYNYNTGTMQGVSAYVKNMRVEVARDIFCD